MPTLKLATPTECTRTEDEVKRMLLEVAFVLHATRAIKIDLVSEPGRRTGPKAAIRHRETSHAV